jgi:hypothetical protein
VLLQLQAETKCLANIQQFNQIVTNLTGFYATSQGDYVQTCIQASKIQISGAQPQIAAILAGMLETIGLSILSGLGGAAGTIAAGIIQAGISALQAGVFEGSGGGLTSPGPMAAELLDSTLANNLNNILTAVGKMVTACQEDWNKMQLLSLLTTNGWPISFKTTASTPSEYLLESEPGFIISSMQTLMPAQWQIYQASSSMPDDCPSNATYQSQYYIADVVNGTKYPACMDLIWNAGVSQEDFFTGKNGWYLGQASVGGSFSGNSNELQITIANLTTNILSAQVNYNLGSGWYPSTSYTQILPNESIIILLSSPDQLHGDNSFQVNIMDLFSGNSQPFVQTELYFKSLLFCEGAEVSFTGTTYLSNPTKLTIPITYAWQGSWSEDYTASAVIVVCEG